jgi:hypothetical protein
MAKDKKTVLLYVDLIHTIEKMDNENAGLYFKHFLRYVNDLNPEPPNILIDVTFEPHKQQLKRDLIKWESERKDRSERGKKGMASRWRKNITDDNCAITEDNTAIPTITKITVTDTVTVKEEERKPKKIFTPPTITEVQNYFKENGYTAQSAVKAFNYYNVADWIDSKGNKIKNWKQKMQGVWFKDENKESTELKIQVSNIIDELKNNHMDWIDSLKPSMYNTTTLGVFARIKDYVRFINSKGVKECGIDSFKDGFGKWYEKHKTDY